MKRRVAMIREESQRDLIFFLVMGLPAAVEEAPVEGGFLNNFHIGELSLFR